VTPLEQTRHLRLRCWLRVGGAEVPGVTVAVGARAATLRFAAGLLDPGALRPRERAALSLRLPGREPVLRTEVELAWWRDDERDLAGAAAVGVGVEWTGLTPEARGALETLLDGYRHTALVVSPAAEERAWLAELLGPIVHVATAPSADEALAVFAERAISVVVVGRAVDDPGRLLAALATATAVARATRLVLAPHPDRPPGELLDLGRVLAAVGKPLQADILLQLVERSAWLHELAVENERLGVELRRTSQRLEQENAYLRRRLTGPAGFEKIIGSSPALRDSLAELERVRRTTATVHIHGETGTGKELVARALHLGGPRADGPFVAQNCAGIPETLLLSALFGHVRGAFTGADRASPGVFKEADGGTLFLDEVAELAPAVQASLLRAVQEREILPVGATRPIKVDVRIISATHKDLREEVRAGRFREDLFYRLMVLHLRLPPLRERRGDVALLAQHFLDLHRARHGRDVGDFTAEALRALEGHAWPGNVRELENEIERIVVLAADGAPITPALLSAHLRGGPTRAAPGAPPAEGDGVFVELATPLDEAIERVEHALVKRALELDRDNLTHAARRLGVKRTRLFKLRERLKLR
jgi:transcriptional regulator with GAF, ATPase, and Fis domain